MRKIQIFKSGGGLQVPQKILDLLLFFLNCQKGMTTLIYQCENYLSPPLDTPLYIQKKMLSSLVSTVYANDFDATINYVICAQ